VDEALPTPELLAARPEYAEMLDSAISEVVELLDTTVDELLRAGIDEMTAAHVRLWVCDQVTRRWAAIAAEEIAEEAFLFDEGDDV
jgi:hypothetical protein